ncbi:heterokaryon incompatibility protein-domain-containing protein [Aspergillus sergii]|uniref:Heterokaryon incompatibility protein-domain-containing protein n=1 Tax=Aspergillus sergii TaxID=1034303 RepID=A0A5N6WS84_9EURO|nr:heterokaryon incompatibility protein-domain-containing protein [Aspergillus sergii]
MLQTTTENLTQLRMPGAFSTKNVTLPRTVRDAMALVKEIGYGYRFLWVDTLCIVQDGPNKSDQIQVMNLIYRRAKLTIVAMAGENANNGLPGVMPGTHIETPTAVIDGYKLQAKPPSFETELKRPRHSTRGWTYQEMLLSPRCLFISPYQYYFRCTIRLWPETWLNYHTSQPVSTLIWPTSSGTPSSDLLISGYEHYVEAYTRRQLTYDNDILHAFTAVLEELSLLFSTTFHDAIPDTNIVRALLWCSAGDGAPERRSSITNPCADSNRYFPSWSWIGWKGPVTYAGSRFGNLRDLTSMCGLLPQTSLFMKPATTTIFQKIETSDTKTIKMEQEKVTCGRPNCCTTLVVTGRTPRITVQDARPTSFAERSPKEHLMGPSPQQLPEKFTKLSILQFRASTVMANSYYFGKCQYESSTNRYDCVNILPVDDSQRRQCGGFFNPAVHTLTVDESQQFAIIAISVFRTTRLPYKDFVDRYYGFEELNPRKCSCLLHVMLIRFHGEIAERVATGIMHPRAWKDAEPGPEYKLINMA